MFKISGIFLKESLLVISLITLTGCFGLPDMISKPASSSVKHKYGGSGAVVTESSESGAIAAVFSANSKETQIIAVSAENSSLAGSSTEFPPGSLSVSTSIQLEEGVDFADDKIIEELGLTGEVTVEATGAPVVISSSVPMDTAKPFTLSIPLPRQASLTQQEKFYVVIFRAEFVSEGNFKDGIIPTTALKIVNGFAVFETNYFGAYQAAQTSAPVFERIEVVTEKVIVTKEVAVQSPMELSSVDRFAAGVLDKVTITGNNFRPTMVLAFNGTNLTNPDIASDTSASFLIPKNVPFGFQNVSISQDGAEDSFKLFALAESTDLPLYTAEPSEVCRGIKYYNAIGDVEVGIKSCVVAECTTNDAIGCVTTSTYKSADLSNLTGGNIKSGVSIAGVAGTLSADLPDPANVRSIDTVGGVAGTLGDCSTDGSGSCRVDGSLYLAAKLSNFAAGNIASGVTIAGVVGNGTTEAHSTCTMDGAIGCIADATYTAALTTGLAAKILTTMTAAGVSGTATAESHSNCNVDGQNDCVTVSSFLAADMSFAVANDIKMGVTIAGIGGAATLESHIACTSDGATGCIADASFTAAFTSGLAAKVLEAAMVAGVSGTAIEESHPLCTSDGQLGCETVGSYLAADMTAVIAPNIKLGIMIAGIAGSLSAGVPPNPFDVRAGKVINGVAGALKTNCRSLAYTSAYDNITPPAIMGLDEWDSIDDFSKTFYGVFPMESPWNPIYSCDSSNFQAMGSDGNADAAFCSDPSDNCLILDRISNLIWSEDQVFTPSGFDAAIFDCENSMFEGFVDWRLPTQKEWMAAYVNGIMSMESPFFVLIDADYGFWTSTTASVTGSDGLVMFMGSGQSVAYPKNDNSIYTMCVRNNI